ncbi:unnamed protein product [Colias eurytheme]|nr:unnamed protein product [Colias eurytheme]
MENPHAARASTFQHRFSVNLWSGVLNGELIGPFELPTRLDGATYRNFLENELPLLLQDVNLELRRTMVFQNDGAPCHYATQEIAYARECSSEQELRQKITEAKRVVKENREAFRRLKHNFLRRCRMCIAAGGGHFENLL